MTEELAGWHRRHGAGEIEPAGPQDYGDVTAEYQAIRAGTALVDRSRWSVFRIAGEGALKFLHAYVSQEVRIDPGQGAYGCVLTVNGGLIGDVWVLARPDDVLAVAAPSAGPGLLKHLRKYAMLARVSIEEAPLALISVWGPRSIEVLTAALGDGPALEAGLSHRALERDGGSVTLIRDDAVGELGWDLLVPQDALVSLLDALVAAGATPVGRRAAEQARVEAGVPLYGVDMHEDTIPLEAGLGERGICTTKGCYLGQEVIARVLHRGRVNRTLTGLVLSDLPASLPVEVFDGERSVGAVTSCVRSPRLGGAALGLGLIHRKARESGRTLTVGAPGSPVTATLRELPVRPEE